MLTTGQGHVVVRDWPSLEHSQTIEAHSSGAFCLELDPRGSSLAVGGSDAVVSIWDTDDWFCQKTLRSMETPIRSLSYSFDGAYICAGSDEPGGVNIDIVCAVTRCPKIKSIWLTFFFPGPLRYW